jgi:hypothetical protein
MSSLRACGAAVLLVCLTGSCQKENPGLLLKVAVAPSSGGITAANVAGMIGQVVLTLKPTAAGGWPSGDAMDAPGLKGVSVQATGAGDTITLDQSKGFLFGANFELLLQPSGQNNAGIIIDGRMFDNSGAPIGKASMTASATLVPGARTSAALQLICTKPDCSPAKGILDLSNPAGVVVQQFTGAAQSDKMTALAAGRLLPGSNGDLVAGVKDKSVTANGGNGQVYVFKNVDFSASSGPIPATNADGLIITGRDSEAIGTAAAIGDFDSDGLPDLVVTGVSATRPYCNDPDTFVQPPLPTAACATDTDCMCNGSYFCMNPGASGKCMGSIASESGAGVAYIIFGQDIAAALAQPGTTLPLKIDLNALSDSKTMSGPWMSCTGSTPNPLCSSPFKHTVRIYGAGSQENLGTAVTVANGTDLALTALAGAPIGGTGKIGRVYYLPGGSTTGTIGALRSGQSGHLPTLLVGDAVLPTTARVAIVVGPGGSSQIGRAVAAGDVDGNGTIDLIVGDNTDGNSSSGTVYVVGGAILSGQLKSPGVVDLSSTSGYDWKITNNHANAFFGYSVAVGDLEGLGKGKDVIIGARQAQQVYVVPGAKLPQQASGQTVDVATLNPLIYKSASTAATSFGNTVAVAALTDPSRLSLMIGAPDDSGVAGDRAKAGAVFIVTDIGGAITAALPARSSFDVAIYGAAAGDGLGDHLVSAQLDTAVNNALAICGAFNASTASNKNAGIIYALDSLPQ